MNRTPFKFSHFIIIIIIIIIKQSCDVFGDNDDDDDDFDDDDDDNDDGDDDDDAGNRSSNLVCPGRAGEPVHLRKPLLLLLTKLANGIQYSILSQSTKKYQKYLEVPRNT